MKERYSRSDLYTLEQFIDLFVAQFFTQASEHIAQLAGANVTVTLLVEYLETPDEFLCSSPTNRKMHREKGLCGLASRWGRSHLGSYFGLTWGASGLEAVWSMQDIEECLEIDCAIVTNRRTKGVSHASCFSRAACESKRAFSRNGAAISSPHPTERNICASWSIKRRILQVPKGHGTQPGTARRIHAHTPPNTAGLHETTYCPWVRKLPDLQPLLESGSDRVHGGDHRDSRERLCRCPSCRRGRKLPCTLRQTSGTRCSINERVSAQIRRTFSPLYSVIRTMVIAVLAQGLICV